MKTVTTFGLMLVLSCWAGAQNLAKPLPDQQARLLERNRVMIEKLVDGTLKLSRTRNSLDKANTYDQLLQEMKKELSSASDAKDASRVKEISRHLGTVLLEGTLPNIEKARIAIAPGSQDEQALYRIRDKMNRTVQGVLDVLGEESEAAKSVQQAKRRIDAVK